jgi:hypothetical protein
MLKIAKRRMIEFRIAKVLTVGIEDYEDFRTFSLSIRVVLGGAATAAS